PAGDSAQRCCWQPEKSAPPARRQSRAPDSVPACPGLGLGESASGSPLCQQAIQGTSFCFQAVQQVVGTAAKVAVKDHGRDGNQNPQGSVVQGNGNATGNQAGVTTGRVVSGKNVDHANNRTKQAQQRGDHGNGAQCRNVLVQLVADVLAFRLDRGLTQGGSQMTIFQYGG